MYKTKSYSRARTRDYMWRKALRKYHIDKKITSPAWGYPYYNNLHQYSKNKIHCSCPMCSAKTRNKGRHRKRKCYAPSINYKMSDLRKWTSMNDQEKEYYWGI